MKNKKTTKINTQKNTPDNQQVVVVVKNPRRKLNVLIMGKDHLNAMMASRWHTARVSEVYRLGSKMKVSPAMVQ